MMTEKRQREKMIEALRFYADPKNWNDGGFEFVGGESPAELNCLELVLSSIDQDQGKKAREALE